MEPQVHALVGLGNADRRYERTRHNIGRLFIDYLVGTTNRSFSSSRQADHVRLPALFSSPDSAELTAIKLPCFMNESGWPLKNLLSQLGLNIENTLVVIDDFMIPFGSIRLRANGSSGGHNGLNSIIDAFGTSNVPRLRFGIGPVPSGVDPADFVLDPFNKDEFSTLDTLFRVAKDGLV